MTNRSRNPISRILFSTAVLACMAIGLAATLFIFKYEDVLGGLREGRMTMVADELQRNIELGAMLGTTLADSTVLKQSVEERLASDPLLLDIRILDENGETVASSSRSIPNALPKQITQSAKNNFDVEIGKVQLTFDSGPLKQRMRDFSYKMTALALGLILLVTALGGLLVAYLQRTGRFGRYAIMAVLPLLAAGMIFLGAVAHDQLKTDLMPEFAAKAESLGRSAASLFARALGYELPVVDLVGVDDFLGSKLKTNPEFSSIRIESEGRTVFHQGRAEEGTDVKVTIETTRNLGSVILAIDPGAVARILKELLLDLLTIMLVSGFLASELLRYMLDDKHASSDAERVASSADLIDLRGPVFLLFFAEDLLRSFLPVFAASLNVSEAPAFMAQFLKPSTLAGLPIISFMLVAALVQPIVGTLPSRFGLRRVLVVASLTATVSYFATATTESITLLLVARLMAGLSWAMVFAAAQAAVLERFKNETRAHGLAYFVGIIMMSSLCGPPIGGILATGIGYRETFVVAGVLALLAALLSQVLLPGATKSEVHARATAGSHFSILGNGRFWQLLLLSAVPAKIILIAYCFYLIPVYVQEFGGTSADAGRIQMLYGIMMVAAVPFFAHFARPSRQVLLVAGGLCVSGLSGLFLLWPMPLTAAAMALVLGIGQAMSIASQSALVGKFCAKEISAGDEAGVYGVYRLLERLGNAIGPTVGATLVLWVGVSGAFVAIGAGVIAGGVMFGGLEQIRKRVALA